MSKKRLTEFILLISSLFLLASPLEARQHGYWQQEVNYVMEIDVDVETHRFEGLQTLTYTNNSPDTLKRVFYHLYFNAFQPNSMMDQRSRTIQDPDGRVLNRIYYLNDEEIGYHQIRSLSQDGEPVEFEVHGTLLEVSLAEPIPPLSETVFEMEFEAQVPLQVRRSGRDNVEGIDFSMSQWYPKIAEYDYMGWHPNPYIAREFHGVFGNFDVRIHIDRDYVVAATGYLQNPSEVGHGYETEGMQVNRPEGDKLMWHFTSGFQHDFMWAADPDYRHVKTRVPNGPLLRFFYQTDPVAENAPLENQEGLLENWQQLPDYTVQAFQYMNEHFGEYPYDEYMVIQGGDGGMEYILGTLITGNRSLQSLVSVTVHELIHAWYQGVLATNESLYHWMDEGFTVYASSLVMNDLFGQNNQNPFAGDYNSYFNIVEAGFEEPMSTHADHFQRNTAYSIASYVKGMMFLHQLSYVIGQDVLDSGLKRYFNEWKFKHPSGLDLIRVMEKESDMVLDWYYDYWVNTTKTIDYDIESVTGQNGYTNVQLRRAGLMPMPLDIEVEYRDGSKEVYYAPLRIMFGVKQNENQDIPRIISDDWPWVFPEYTLEIQSNIEDIRRIEIDPSRRMADVNREGNIWLAE